MVYLGFIPMQTLLDQGVNVCLGSDSAAAANSLDIFKEMRVAALIHKGHHADPSIVPAERVLEMATINGAKTLAWDDEIGSLEPGKKADVIIVDTEQPWFAPHHDIVSQLVYCADGKDTDTVIASGQVVMENKKILIADVQEVVREADRMAANVLKRQGITVKQRYPVR
jgi:5-methylthioadenosine/S-adenosylhomocysteine deaminase